MINHVSQNSLDKDVRIIVILIPLRCYQYFVLLDFGKQLVTVFIRKPGTLVPSVDTHHDPFSYPK